LNLVAMAKRATKQQQPPPPCGHFWSVYHIKHTPAKFVGIIVEASNEQTAIAKRSRNIRCRPMSARQADRASAAGLIRKSVYAPAFQNRGKR
jgi:hypothetical protein